MIWLSGPSDVAIIRLGVVADMLLKSLSSVLGLTRKIEKVETRMRELEALLDDQRRHLQVATVTDWIGQAALRTAPLISVVLPRAIAARCCSAPSPRCRPDVRLLGAVDRR